MAGVARAGLENKGGEDEGLAVAQQTGERGPCRNSEKEWGGRRWCRVSVGRMWWGGCMEGRVLPGLGKDGAARLSRWEPLGSRDAHLEPPLVSLAAVRDSSALVRVRAHDCLDQSKG